MTYKPITYLCRHVLLYYYKQELAAIYENTKDRWRALGYQKAIAAIRRHPKPITTFEVSLTYSFVCYHFYMYPQHSEQDYANFGCIWSWVFSSPTR